jgi:hypothetical protein
MSESDVFPEGEESPGGAERTDPKVVRDRGIRRAFNAN